MPRPHGPSWAPQRILLIVDRCGPGDALRLLGLVEAVCRAEPDAHVVLVCSEQAAAVLGRIPGLDRLVVSRLYGAGNGTGLPSRARQAIEFARLVRAVGRRHDLAIVFHWGGTVLDLLARLAARVCIGYENGIPWLLSSRLGRFTSDSEVLQNRALLQAAGIEIDDAKATSVYDDSDLANARMLVDRIGFGGSDRLVVLHTGSDWACQQWLPERWAMLAEHLRRRYGPDLVFTGLQTDGGHIARIQELLGTPVAAVHGCTTIRELAALISLSRLCVTVDAATYELAQLTGVPVVVLAGPSRSDPLPGTSHRLAVVNRTPPAERLAIGACQQQFPAGRCQNWRCPMAGLARIAVQDVIESIDRLRAVEPVPSSQA
jgi:ADP-heptose:LPS heptosyltransferase